MALKPLPLNERLRIAGIVAPLIGRPYKVNGIGPDFFGCWGLTVHIQRVIFYRDLSPLDIQEGEDSIRAFIKKFKDNYDEVAKDWHLVKEPEHGAVVELSHANHIHHVGTFINIDGGGILHAVEGAGVCFDPVWHMKLSGWKRLVYHAPNDNQ